MTRRGFAAALLALVLTGILTFGSALAQTGVPAAAPATETSAVTEVPPPSPNDIKELLRLLGDERIVNWLKTEAESTGADAEGDGTGFTVSFREQITGALERIRQRGQLLRAVGTNLAHVPDILARKWQQEVSGSEVVRSFTYVIIFLIIGGGLEWLYRQYTANRLLKIELATPETLGRRLTTALARVMIILGGLIVFALGSIGGFLTFDWKPFVEIIVVNLLLTVLIIRTVATLSRFVIAPNVPELRLAPFDNAKAKRIHQTTLYAVSVGTVALAFADTFERLAATGQRLSSVDAATFAVSIFAGVVFVAAVLVAVWRLSGTRTAPAVQPHAPVRGILPRNPRFWRIYLSGVAVAAFGLWLIDATSLMATLLVIGLLPAVSLLVFGWIDHFFDEAEDFDRERARAEDDAGEAENGETEAEEEADEAGDDADYRGRYDLYRPIAQRFARFIVVVGAVLVLLPAWGTDIFTLSESTTLSGRIASVAIDLVVALLIADLVWTWAKTAIDRKLADYKPPEGPQAPGPEARLATLLPMLRMMLMVTLVVMIALSVLSSMGVNIAPLLAGAGVVGVAIGFGSQALVKDIVSGIFFLIDDAFRVGEYIEIGDLRGTVESMSIRSLRVRHHRGAVHTIPFGELTALTNYSRDWVIMKMEFRVPFETDIKLVKKIVKRIGAEMAEDPNYKDGFIQPLKSQGVRRMEEFNMVVGVKFMSKPGDQWIIRRDAYQKIVDAFEENGIRLAERNVKVEVVSDRPLTAAEHEAVVGAAQDAVDQPLLPPGPVPDEP